MSSHQLAAKLVFFTVFLCLSCYVHSATSLFKVSASGTPDSLSITLCLNGKGPASCEYLNIDALSLNIRTVIPNKEYAFAGIKLNTPEYTLAGCSLIENGFCLFSVSNSSAASIAISPKNYALVTIGNPNNNNDPQTNRGAVNHIYKIGKYPVTIAQYTEFLNSVAKTDTYGLYDTRMATDLNVAGISRYGTPGNYRYEVINNGGMSSNRPIAYVTYFNAVRYINWESNGKPMGLQTAATTENGTYPLNGKKAGTSVARNTINPNTGLLPLFYLPSDDEWYKAAYYDPRLKNGQGGYYLYATQSNETPGNLVGTEANLANWVNFGTVGFTVTQSLTWEVESTNYLTDVGTFINSPSFYGTFDQSGNLGEMTNDDDPISFYCFRRGGFWFGGNLPMQNILYAQATLTKASNDTGFRLAATA